MSILSKIFKSRNCILYTVWCIVMIMFFTIHLTGDFQCFISWARQTHNSSSTGIASLSETWELKGLFLRSIFLLLYNLSALFFNDVTLEFQYVFKLFGLLFLNIIIAAAVYFFPKRYIPDNFSKKQIFCICGILLFSVHFASHLQAEFIAVPILLFATSLYLNDSLYLKIVAGILVGLTFFLKSPIPIMGGSLMAISMMLKKSSFKDELLSILPLGIGMVVFIFGGIVFLHHVSPQEIKDMIDASVFQHTLLSSPISFKSLIINFIRFTYFYSLNYWYNPLVITPILAIVISLAKREYRIFVLLSLALFFPMAYVVLSNCYFVYHYYLFAYISIIAFCYLLSVNSYSTISGLRLFVLVLITSIIAFLVNPIIYKVEISGKLLVCIIILSTLLSAHRMMRHYSMYIIFCMTTFSYWINSSSLSASNIRAVCEYEKLLKENPNYGHKLGKDPILYLDSGGASFYLTNKSYLRYTYPLPIQRTDETCSNFVENDTYKVTRNNISQYKYDYLLLDKKWFFSYRHDWISSFIEHNYSKEYELNCPSWSWNLFCFSQLSDCKIELFRRK